jgi:hypothetical protein
MLNSFQHLLPNMLMDYWRQAYQEILKQVQDDDHHSPEQYFALFKQSFQLPYTTFLLIINMLQATALIKT